MIVGKKKILSHSIGGHWHINEDYAIAAWEQYYETLTLIKNGVISVEETAKPELGAVSNVVPLKGTMFVEDTWCDYGALSVAAQLDELYANKEVPFITMEVNSGGGMSQAGYIVRDKISQRNKPVYAYVLEAGSAALNAISTSDKIFLANEASGIGSIGSYYSINKKSVEEYQKTFDDIYAEQSTEKNGAFRAYLKGDKSPLKKDATESASLFIQSISAARNIPIDSPVMTGGMYYGNKAIELGLADAIVGSMSNLPNFIKNSEEKILNHKNSTMKSIISALNRIFNWTLKEDSTENELTEQLNAQETVAALVSAGVTKQLESLNTIVLEQKESISKLTASFDTLQKEVVGLKDENGKLVVSNAAITAAKENLEKELLAEKSKRDEQHLSNDFKTVEDDFLGTLNTYKVGFEVAEKKK